MSRNKRPYKHRRVGGRLVDVHVYIWTSEHGAIPHGYVVHHKDGDNWNNDIENLECIPLSVHSRIHSSMQKRDSYGRYK